MLRSLAIVLGFALAVSVAPAEAQPDPAGFAPREPERSMRQPEHLSARPSGFWTSNQPAVGGAYRYRIMGMGAIVLGITGLLVLRMIRRANATSVRARKS